MMNKAKTFKLGVSPTCPAGGASSLRSKPRPYLVVVPPGKDNENIINTHVTQSESGK